MSFDYVRELPSPDHLKELLPVSRATAEMREARVDLIKKVISGDYERLLLIIGPCSADNEEAVVDDNAMAENDIVSVGNENVPASELPSNEIASTVDNAEENGIVVGASRNDFNIRYEKSFMAKLIQSSDETKAYYSELKNEVLSYGKTKSHVSWAYDSVNAGRAPVLKFNVRGKTLCVYFALNVDDYANSKYKVEKARSAKYESVPCMYRIKNDRRLGYAKDLIAAVCEKRGLTKGDVPTEDYRLPYESTEALLEKGLVKELPVATAKNESNA